MVVGFWEESVINSSGIRSGSGGHWSNRRHCVFFSDAAVTILALVLIRRITHAQLQHENPHLLPAGTAPAGC